MNKPYPPIPKGHPNFIVAYGQDWFEVASELSDEPGVTTIRCALNDDPCGSSPWVAPLSVMRKLVSDSARCWWLDETHRLRMAAGETWDRIAEQAFINAEEWREWGEQK